MAALQEGIYHAPGRRPGRHFALLFLRVLPGVGAAAAASALGELWAMYEELKAGRIGDLEGVALPLDDDAMTVLLGFGRNAPTTTFARQATSARDGSSARATSSSSGRPTRRAFAPG